MADPSDAGALSAAEIELAAATRSWLERPGLESAGGDPDELLFAELGRLARQLAAEPSRAGNLAAGPAVTAEAAVPEGLFGDLALLGRRIFNRVRREFADLLCGTGEEDVADRERLRDAFGLGGDALTAAIASVLISAFGLAPAAATIIAALLLRRVVMPTVEETCVRVRGEAG
jgi:hypothetical protein